MRRGSAGVHPQSPFDKVRRPRAFGAHPGLRYPLSHATIHKGASEPLREAPIYRMEDPRQFAGKLLLFPYRVSLLGCRKASNTNSAMRWPNPSPCSHAVRVCRPPQTRALVVSDTRSV